MLFLNNDDVKQVLTMELTMNALDKAYREPARQEAVCRPRIDIQIPTVIGKWLEEGTHATCVGGKPDDDTLKRIDVSLRLGTAPAPWGLPEFALADEYITYAAKLTNNAGFQMKRAGNRGHGVIAEASPLPLPQRASERG